VEVMQDSTAVVGAWRTQRRYCDGLGFKELCVNLWEWCGFSDGWMAYVFSTASQRPSVSLLKGVIACSNIYRDHQIQNQTQSLTTRTGRMSGFLHASGLGVPRLLNIMGLVNGFKYCPMEPSLSSLSKGGSPKSGIMCSSHVFTSR